MNKLTSTPSRALKSGAPDFKGRIMHRARPIAAAVLLSFGVQSAHAATVTYIVGTCQAGTQFKTIQSALNASPAPTTVEVCPGTYAEQVNIKRPVTLEGITAANGALAQIELPANYAFNAVLKDEGENAPAVAQIYVNNVTGGSVNLSNLVVNGEGFGTNSTLFIGVVYQQSSGTIDHLITFSQDANAGATHVVGWGLWIDGGSTNPTVTVQNSSFNAASSGGIFATGETESGEDVSVNIHNNFVNATEGYYGMVLEEGANATVSGNVINAGRYYGIYIDAPKGSITGNTILNSAPSAIGIGLYFDGPAVTSNTIYGGEQGEGIDVAAPTLKLGKIENNTIYGATNGSTFGTGIDLNCLSYSSGQINSNTIINEFYGYGDVHAGFSTSGSNFGVNTEFEYCLNSAARSQHVAAARAKVQAQLRGRQED